MNIGRSGNNALAELVHASGVDGTVDVCACLEACVHALRACVHALRACVHALRVCVHALRVCVQALRVCVHALRVCVQALRAPSEVQAWGGLWASS